LTKYPQLTVPKVAEIRNSVGIQKRSGAHHRFPFHRDSWCAMAENMQLASAATVKPLKDDTLLLIACLVVFFVNEITHS